MLVAFINYIGSVSKSPHKDWMKNAHDIIFGKSIIYYFSLFVRAVSDMVRVQSIAAVCLPRGKSNLVNKFIFSDSVLNFLSRFSFNSAEVETEKGKTLHHIQTDSKAPDTRAHFTLENFLSHGIINWINYKILPLWRFYLRERRTNINSKNPFEQSICWYIAAWSFLLQVFITHTMSTLEINCSFIVDNPR